MFSLEFFMSLLSVVQGAAPPQARRWTGFSKSLFCLIQCSVKANYTNWKCYKCCNFGPNTRIQTEKINKLRLFCPWKKNKLLDAWLKQNRPRVVLLQTAGCHSNRSLIGQVALSAEKSDRVTSEKTRLNIKIQQKGRHKWEAHRKSCKSLMGINNGIYFNQMYEYWQTEPDQQLTHKCIWNCAKKLLFNAIS